MTTNRALGPIQAAKQRQSILNRARINRLRFDCPEGGPECPCHGFVDTGELRNMAAQYGARVFELRNDFGWYPAKAGKVREGYPGKVFYYHFLKKVPVQVDINLGKVNRLICELKLSGKLDEVATVEVFAVKKMRC